MRENLKDKKRIVFKVGSSTLTHKETGALDLVKMEKFVRILTDLHNQGKEIVVVSSGAILVGRKALGNMERPTERSVKQACAAVGQCRLMTVYQKLFSEYNQNTAQILMTKITIANDISRHNAQNTFRELLNLGVIPIVNENDTVATDEIDLSFSDNDFLSVERITDEMLGMAKGPSTDMGTGGMSSKVGAAGIANDAGADMVIINGDDMEHINQLLAGEEIGTLFKAHKTTHFHLKNYLDR